MKRNWPTGVQPESRNNRPARKPWKTTPSNTTAAAASTARGIRAGTLSIQAGLARFGRDSSGLNRLGSIGSRRFSALRARLQRALAENEVALNGEISEEQECFD